MHTYRGVTEWIGGLYVNGKVFFGLQIPDLDSILVGMSPRTKVTGWDSVQPRLRPLMPWLIHSAFDLMVGLGFGLLALGAWLGLVAAAYLIVDARHSEQPDMVSYFSRRARVAGVVTGLVAAATLADLHFAAPREFTRLTAGPALPFLIVSAVAVTTVFALLTAGRTWAVRPLAAAAVAAVIWGWGVAQWPYLLPPSLTVQAGQAPGASLAAILAISGLVAVLVGPGMIVLFTLRNKGKLSEEDERDVTEADLPGLQAADADASSPQPAAGGGPGPPARPRLRNLAFAAAGFLAGAALARRNGGTRTESDVRNP